MEILKQEKLVRWVKDVEQFAIGKYEVIKKQIMWNNNWTTEHVRLIRKIGK